MIMKKTDKIIHKMLEILGNDSEIQRLLFYSIDTETEVEPSLEQLINHKYLTDYPVVLEGNEKFSFISIHHDNTVFDEDSNVYVITFKVACGVSLDAWTLEDGSSRLHMISDRIEELLKDQYLCGSTSPLSLVLVQSVFWNTFITGNSFIFQLEEKGAINETII